MRTTRQRWPSCGIRGAPDPRFLNRAAHDLLRWAKRLSISLLPQFIMGRNTVLANSFSCLNPILGSGWTLKLSAFQQLRRRWPVLIDLFATSLTVAYLIFLHSTIPVLLGQRFFSNHGMGGRRMLFLSMR